MAEKSEISISAFGWLLAFGTLAGGLFMAKITQPSDVDFVKDPANGCNLVSAVETGKRLYCGKACTTPEYRHTFQCNNDQEMVVDWFDLREH